MENNKKDLTIRRLLAITFVLMLGIPVVFSLLPGCESSPSEPVYNNPFDPLGPDGGDPLQVRATAFNDTTVKLTWNQPQGMGITKYVISSSPQRESGWGVIGNQDHTANPTTDFDYHDAASTSTTWYRVQAFTDTEFTITSYATPDSATTGPRVIVGTGFGHTATRLTNLETIPAECTALLPNEKVLAFLFSFGVVTRPTRERAALEEYGGAQAGAVVDSKFLDVEDGAGGQLNLPPALPHVEPIKLPRSGARVQGCRLPHTFVLANSSSRSSRLKILSTVLLGRLSRKSIWRGTLYEAS